MRLNRGRDKGCESYLAIAAAMNDHLDCIKYAPEHNFTGFIAQRHGCGFDTWTSLDREISS